MGGGLTLTVSLTVKYPPSFLRLPSGNREPKNIRHLKATRDRWQVADAHAADAAIKQRHLLSSVFPRDLMVNTLES